MANKPVDMSKLEQVLRLYKNGDMSNRKNAETVELDKRCFIIAAMPCFACRGLRSPDCLTSLVSMPYVLTDALISLLTVPLGLYAWL